MLSVAALLGLASLLLIAPRLLLAARGPTPEVHGLLAWLWWLNAAYCGAVHGLRVVGTDPLPARGPAILIANHTSGADVLLLQASCHRVLGFLIAQEMYDHPLIGPMARRLGCIPVRRDGRDLGATRAALRALAEGRVVPMFPVGKILPDSGRTLGAGKSGVAFLAHRSRVPVVPAYICGTPPTSNIWRGLLTPSASIVRLGSPVDLHDLLDAPGKPDLDAITARLMGAVEALKSEGETPE